MKNNFIVKIIIAVLVFARCSPANKTVDNSTAPKQMLFDYPDDMFADTAKKRFEKEFKQGTVLYKMSCSKCHNITVDGKEIIPDFSLPQLMDYELRFQYAAHGDELKEASITHDELEWIVLFLRYKKKTNYNINDYLKR
jgi:hypothetical protein